MIKRVLTLFLSLTLALCIPSPTFSSEISVDSLKATLNALPLGDEARKKPLIKLAEFFIYLDPKKTEQYATEVLALLINANDNHIFRAQALRLLGHAQMYQGLNQEAFAHLNQAITSAKHTQNNHLISVAYRVMGVFYELTIDHDNALKYYIEALKFAKKSNFKEDSAMVYNNLGNVLNSQNDYENATKYFEQSITLNTELNDIPMKMNASVGLSVSLLKLGKLSEAKALLKDVIKNRALISDFSFSEASVNLAHVYKLLKDFPAAESLYKFVINDEQGGSYLPAVASAYLGLADLLTQTNQIEAAIALYKQGIIEVKDKISLESEMELYEHLAKLELSQENFKAASKIQSQYIERRNQVQPLIPTGIVQKLEDQLKMERDYRILQEELLVSERESLNSSLYLFAVIVFSLLSLVLFLVLMIRKQVIERLEARNKTLKKASETDPLTGIGNRRFLDHKINAFQGQDISMAFLLLDIDHFKEINDNFGHDVGDNILVVIAETIKKLCRKDDLFARIGGEEFVILTFSNNEESATLFAERIRTTIEGMSRSFESTVTASIGIALGNMKSANYDELYKQADIALYSAKNQGRNKVLLYSKENSTIEQGELII
jgi:diguanylate cyclase (GGDEF)-like protein